MEFSEFAVECQDPAPVYRVAVDPYLRRQVFKHVCSRVEESARGFDWSVFDLSEDEPHEIVDSARTLPWMSDRRWVYVRNGSSKTLTQPLADYVRSPSKRTVLVLETDKLPRGWPRIPVIDVPKRMDFRQWVRTQASEKGFKISPAAARLLVERVGDDLQRLDQELERLYLLCLDSKTIDEPAVEGSTQQAREYEIFMLNNAIANRRPDQALRILGTLFDRGLTAPLLISTLYSNFRRLLVAHELLNRGVSFQTILRDLKLWSYKSEQRTIRSASPSQLRAILVRLRQADVQCKSTSVDERWLLERLIIDMPGMHSI